MIWFKKYSVEEIESFMYSKKGLAQLLDIHLLEMGDNFLKLSMPITESIQQVHGIMHGGATCVLVETAGSIASGLCLDPSKAHAVGSQIHVNHLRPVKDGMLMAICKSLHLGRQKHVWDIEVYAESTSKLIAKGELTCAVIKEHGYDQ